MDDSSIDQEAPTEEAPTEETPTEEAPTEEAPTEEAPTEEAPTEEAPTEEAPTEEAPTEETPTEETEAEPTEETQPILEFSLTQNASVPALAAISRDSHYYVPSGTKFIKEMTLVNTSKGDLEDIVSDILDKDLNETAGGEDIYLGWNTTTDPTQAITGLMLRNTGDQDEPTKEITQNSVKWHLVNSNCCSVAPRLFDADDTTENSNSVDLNDGAGGDYVWLYVTKDHSFGPPLDNVAAQGGTSTSSTNWEMVSDGSSVIDVNAGTEETAIYLRVHTPCEVVDYPNLKTQVDKMKAIVGYEEYLEDCYELPDGLLDQYKSAAALASAYENGKYTKDGKTYYVASSSYGVSAVSDYTNALRSGIPNVKGKAWFYRNEGNREIGLSVTFPLDQNDVTKMSVDLTQAPQYDDYAVAGWTASVYGGPILTGTVTVECGKQFFACLSTDHTHDGKTFYSWLRDDALPTAGGNYCLVKDVTLSGDYYATSPSRDLSLCLHGHSVTKNGNIAVIVLETDCTLEIFDCSDGETGKITHAQGKKGPGVEVTTGEFVLHGGSITGNTSDACGGVYVYDGSLTVKGGSISGNKATSDGGGVFVEQNGSFTMTGGDISDNEASDGAGGVCVASSSTFTMSGGSIQNNTGNNGGGVYVQHSKFTLTGGIISGNQANNGGGVYVYDSSTFNMSGGTITGNKATSDGGGVYSNSASLGTCTINISGGSLTNNEAAQRGGGVYVQMSNLNLSGGSITGNKAQQGDGVYISGGSSRTLKFSGSPQIKDNDGQNLYLENNPVEVGALNQDASIGVTLSGTTGTFTSNAAAEYADRFFSDNGDYGVHAASDDKLQVSSHDLQPTSDDSNHWEQCSLCGEKRNVVAHSYGEDGYCQCGIHGHGDGMTFVPWTETTSLPDTAGNYVLTADVNLSGIWRPRGETKLCLCGYDIIGQHQNVIHVYQDAALEIYDCADASDPGRITHKEGTVGRGVCVSTGSFALHGGTITGNTTEDFDSDGGGVFVNTGSSFTMTGGSITSNTALDEGGGVHNAGTFTMSGGTIRENTAKDAGGGVYNDVDATFRMTGGVITGNKATNPGGGVYVSHRATFKMSGGTISGNTATNSGGGVYVNYSLESSFGTFTMTGGSITGNTAEGDGGGVDNNGTFTMSGGSITGNTATQSGGGVWNYDTFTMTGGEISGNTAKEQFGGGVDNYGIFTMSGDSIICNNTANWCGGGVQNFGTFTLSGGTIRENTAKDAGGGVYNDEITTFRMTGGVITGNKATNTGGGVYTKGSLILSGGTITGNTVGEAASNMYLQSYYYITIGDTGLAEGTTVGITMENTSGVFTSNGAAQYADYFTSDDSAYRVEANTDGKLALVENHVHDYVDGFCTCGLHRHEDGMVFQPTATLPGLEGNYVLTADVEISKYWSLGSSIHLCLHGHSITRTEAGETIFVYSDVTLDIYDCAATPGRITHAEGVAGCGVYVYENATFNLHGGSIAGNTDDYGGGVFNLGIFNMTGGSITGNKASDTGGGVRNADTFTISGGSITGNEAKRGGGVSDMGIFTMSGGSITGNKATSDGGGVYCYYGPTLSGSSVIKDNHAGDRESNLRIYRNTFIDLAELTEGASIGITMENGTGTFTSNAAADYVNYFFSDDSAYRVEANTDGKLALVENHVHDWSDTWSKDGTSHWKTCSGCDEKDSYAEHSYENGKCECGAVPQPEGTYIVTGDKGLCGSAWDARDENNKMTWDGNVYKKVYPSVPAGRYELKVVKNEYEAWIPDGGNVIVYVDTVCDVTVIYDLATNTVTVTGDGLGTAPAPTFEALYVAGNGTEGGAWMNGLDWEPGAEANKMTQVSDHVYQITFRSVPAGDYEFMFTGDSWSTSWGGSFQAFGTESPAVSATDNKICFSLTALSDVTLELDLTTCNRDTMEGGTFTVTIVHTHSWFDTWSSDENGHWYACSGCDEKKDEAAHTYGDWISTGNNVHQKSCTCGYSISDSCANNDSNHNCDLCGATLTDCMDADNDHNCDICGEVLSQHTGGTATCTDLAVCEICKEAYGEVNTSNHASTDFTYQIIDANSHEKRHACCGTAAETADHAYSNGFCLCGAHQHEDGTVFLPTATLPTTAGNYYLTADVEISNEWLPASSTKLCLNGHSITQTGGSATIRIDTIRVKAGVTLALSDCQGSGIITRAKDTSGSGVYIQGGDFLLHSGAITGHNGSGVTVHSGTFTMNGGTISDNTAQKGGGVSNDGTFQMTGGTISGNTVDGDGGGVRNRGTFEIKGGSITGNAANIGGGVWNNGTFKMAGGAISDNTASSSSGGVQNGNFFTMTGGSITGNRAETFGGGVNNGSTMTVSGKVTIRDNTAPAGSNLVLWNYPGYETFTYVSVEELDPQSFIGVTCLDCDIPTVTYFAVTGTITTNDAAAYQDRFVSDDSRFHVDVDESGKLVLVSDHEHSWSDTWSSDENGHWYECQAQDCDITENSGKKGYAAHAYGDWSHVEGTKTHRKSCACGYSVTEDCSGTDDNNCETALHCDTCGNELVAAGDHSYDDACDTTCNNCSHTREITHDYQQKSDEQKHWMECSICHVTKDEADHAYGEWSQVEGTKTHSKSCACGYSVTEDCSGTNDNNCETALYCDTCGNELVAAGDHSYDDACDTDCNTCGAVREIIHDYQQKSDDQKHWMECSICHITKDEADHAYGEWSHVEGTKTHSKSCDCGHSVTEDCAGTDDSNCETALHCDTCGNELVAVGDHSYDDACDTTCNNCSHTREITHDYQLKSDDQKHWMECSICHVTKDEADHAYGEWSHVEGTKTHSKSCACGHSVTEDCTDEDDHMCDVCGTTISQCADGDNDHNCDVCGATISQHTGGEATCTDQAVCALCRQSYGEKNPNNHASEECTYTNNGDDHTKAHQCCGASTTEAHSYVDGKCICGAEEFPDREYVEITLEVGQTATATQNGLSNAMSKGDITVGSENIVSVSMTVSKKTSGGNSWWGGWFGSWWGSSNGKTTYDHTITFTGKSAGTTIVQVGNVYYKVTVTEPHVHSYTAVVTDPTCTDKGYTTYTCECGDHYVSDYKDPLGHDYEDGVCGNCGQQEPQKPTTFAPKCFTASLSCSSVNVGKSATITVKTSADVEYVTINGQKVTAYKTTTSGWGWNRTTYRTFTYTVNEKTAGTYQYEIFAFNADDAQSDTSRTVKLTVKASSGGIGSGWWWWR